VGGVFSGAAPFFNLALSSINNHLTPLLLSSAPLIPALSLSLSTPSTLP